MRQLDAPVFVLLGGVAAAGAASYALNELAVAMPLQCVHSIAQEAAIGCGAALVLTGVITLFRPFGDAPRLLLTWLLLVGASLWLGSYRLSPLGFGGSDAPLLQGFMVRRVGRSPIMALSRTTLSVNAGAIVQVVPRILPNARPYCYWASEASAEIDDPQSCDIAYRASPGIEVDVLRLRVHSACGLPDAVGELRFSVLP